VRGKAAHPHGGEEAARRVRVRLAADTPALSRRDRKQLSRLQVPLRERFTKAKPGGGCTRWDSPLEADGGAGVKGLDGGEGYSGHVC
jgi:hypothetical protein